MHMKDKAITLLYNYTSKTRCSQNMYPYVASELYSIRKSSNINVIHQESCIHFKSASFAVLIMFFLAYYRKAVHKYHNMVSNRAR